MKNIFKFGILALFLGMTACEDATDIIQKGELNEDAAFSTVADLETGLNAAYDSYTPDAASNGTGDVVLFNDLFTDNLKRGLDGNGQGSSEYNFLLQPADSAPETVWQGRYYTINVCNRILRAADRILLTLTDPDDVAQVNTFKGELLALRAIAHFDLFQYFTVDYKNLSSLSVIKMDFVPNLEDSFERNTTGEIIAFIKEDIAASLTFLGESNLDTKNYINKNFVKALNARLSIVTGDNASALSIVNDLDTTFDLATREQYSAMFADQASPELITSLKRARTNDNQTGQLYYANSVTITGSPFLEMSEQLYNLYNVNDIRYQVNVQGTNDANRMANAANGIHLIGKYPGTADLLVNDFKLFRFSEMVLIKAEAQARLGDLDGAAASVKAIRDARYLAGTAPVAPVFANLNQALTVILEERRKELAFEGHRYLDLKRIGGELGIGVNRLASDAATFSAPTTLPANDYRFTLPIPRSELSANRIITQNPGYPAN